MTECSASRLARGGVASLAADAVNDRGATCLVDFVVLHLQATHDLLILFRGLGLSNRDFTGVISRRCDLICPSP
jgi:hypothetical protein